MGSLHLSTSGCTLTLFEDLDVDMSDAELHTLYRPEELVVDHTETVADIAFCESVMCTFWKFEGVLLRFGVLKTFLCMTVQNQILPVKSM